VHTYGPESHARFAETINQSYGGSLDCPALNGRRNIEDVIAGHQSTGLFDPGLWLLLSERGEGRGVVLLNPTVTGESVELVYLGVVPGSRGRGVGDGLLRLGIHHVVERGWKSLSLAVDSRNAPALGLYHRHGLKRVGSRLAMIRDLRAAGLAAVLVHIASPKSDNICGPLGEKKFFGAVRLGPADVSVVNKCNSDRKRLASTVTPDYVFCLHSRMIRVA
jgi:GNAT superfamily N-acetyltransferase